MHTGGVRGGVRGGEGGIKVYPPSKIFAKLVNKNAIKHQKGVPSQKNFHNPYIPSLPKFGKNLHDPPSRISNRVHLWGGGRGGGPKLNIDSIEKNTMTVQKSGNVTHSKMCS
jgi:hypothetical protein